jgi:RND family efflux transporter MFP subunit
VTLVAALQGCGHGSPDAKQDGAGTLERAIAARPERKTLTLSTTQPGRIEAFEESPLYAKLAGYVDNVQVDIGDPVQKDQTLVKLSIPELVDELAQKEALVAQAEAVLEQSKSSIDATIAAADTAESKIAEAQAGVARAQAEHERWKSEHERIAELAAKGSVAKKLEDETSSQLQAADAANREAMAKVESAKAAHYEAQANVSKARSDQRAAEARLRVAHADLARAKTMLAYTEIKAPYDGMVTRRNVDTGHYVHPATAAAGEPLLVVARTDQVRIFIDVPELEAPLVDKGDPADVIVQALPTHKFDGVVARTSWSLLELNHALVAEVDIDNPQGALRPGMYANVTIRLDERQNTLVLPSTAIVRDGAQTCCMLVAGSKIEKRPVAVGLRTANEVEIVSGLEEGSTVVVKDPQLFKPGQQVNTSAPAK